MVCRCGHITPHGHPKRPISRAPTSLEVTDYEFRHAAILVAKPGATEILSYNGNVGTMYAKLVLGVGSSCKMTFLPSDDLLRKFSVLEGNIDADLQR